MGKRSWIIGVAVGVIFASSCAPDVPPSAATRLDVQTNITVCGGVEPPPGEPGCHTSPTVRPFEVRQDGTVVATGTTGADGHLVVEVPAGELSVHAVDPPSYMDCDSATVVVVEGETTPVVQTCTFYAP